MTSQRRYSYQQVYESLETQIESGVYKPGDFLPPEPELCRQFNVSRTTVRKAVEILRARGLVLVQQGRGTTIAEPGIHTQRLNTITSFSETLKTFGMKGRNKVLSCRTVPATDSLAQELRVTKGEDLLQLRRLVIADGRPLAIMCNHLVARYFPNFGSDDEWGPSLYRYLEEKYGIRLLSTEDRISARLATAEEARILEMEAPVALLVNHRVSSDPRGPFESMELLVDGTRYEFSVTGSGRRHA